MSASDSFHFKLGVDIWLKQVKTMSQEQYQRLIWSLFQRILRATPQWSGKAVANWNISVGSPDMEVYVDDADEVDSILGTDLKKGDTRWMQVARDRNRPKLKAIKYTDKVFIANGVSGDDKWGDGHTTFAYMAAFQNPAEWRARLREVNQPYETVSESLLIVASNFMKEGLGLSKVGGNYKDYE